MAAERERERGKNERRQRWREKREGERGREILLINDVSIYSAHIFRSIQPYMYVEADQMFPPDKSSVNKTAASSLNALIYDMRISCRAGATVSTHLMH